MRAKLLICILLTTMVGSAHPAYVWAEDATTPITIISGLNRKLTIAGQGPQRPDRFSIIISNALSQLKSYSDLGGTEAAFVERAGDDSTPLVSAVYNGYSEIVENLLRKKIVQASVNNIEENGLSAWMYANFSLKQNYWVCNPTVLRNRSEMVALVSVLPYYLEGTERAYFRTRRLLEEAGAKQDMEGVKRKWLETCQRATAESRQKVLSSPDLLLALETEGLRILTESRAGKQP